MSRVLRYASIEDLPPALRSQVTDPKFSDAEVEVLRRNARGPGKSTLHQIAASPKRKPRRDEEHNEQVVFFNRIRTLALNDPRYALASRRTFAIPNGGGRSKREAGRLKAEGVTKGVSDIFCSLPAGGFHGLYIEMKSATGRVSEEQNAWCEESKELGYFAVVCRSADEAFKVWQAYVGLLSTP